MVKKFIDAGAGPLPSTDDESEKQKNISTCDRVLNPYDILIKFGYITPRPDADGKWNGCILPPEQYLIFLRLSFLSLFSSIFAFFQKHYDLAVVPFIIFCTSVNFWRRPEHGLRRNIDIICVQIGMWYQIFRAYNAENMMIFYIVYFIGCSFFVLSRFQKCVWISTLCHMMVHILGNVGNVLLYSGNINPCC